MILSRWLLECVLTDEPSLATPLNTERLRLSSQFFDAKARGLLACQPPEVVVVGVGFFVRHQRGLVTQDADSRRRVEVRFTTVCADIFAIRGRYDAKIVESLALRADTARNLPVLCQGTLSGKPPLKLRCEVDRRVDSEMDGNLREILPQSFRWTCRWGVCANLKVFRRRSVIATDSQNSDGRVQYLLRLLRGEMRNCELGPRTRCDSYPTEPERL